jgi:hypothetical protein
VQGEGPGGIQFSPDGKHIAYTVPQGLVTEFFPNFQQVGVLTLNLGFFAVSVPGQAVVLDCTLVGGGPYDSVSYVFNAASTQLTITGTTTPSAGTTLTTITTVKF